MKGVKSFPKKVFLFLRMNAESNKCCNFEATIFLNTFMPMKTNAKIESVSNRSSEKFEVDEIFLKISEQIKSEIEGRTLDEAIDYLVGKVDPKMLFRKRLKTVWYSIGTMNRIIDAGNADKMIKISEALQVHGIEMLGEAVAARPEVKAILIAGPSSSGKTTFSKKLAQSLERNGLVPKCISFDDYYVDRARTPLDEDGEYDYESLYAVDVALFQRHFQQLLAGEEVELPRYDFIQGRSVKSGNRLALTSDTVLIMEGIHALNPILTGSIPDENLFRIYISGLTVAKNDDGSYYPTTDNRLIRRMVRDAQFRGTSAQETLARWVSVRRGEDKWIVPFQENADVNFCTAFQYELSLLKTQAIPLLKDVSEGTPEYQEAQRLKWVLNRFHDIPEELLPPYSLLREFIGGSAFEY